ncbi:DUF4352 domain-containing protein [Dysgonomonas sp. 511]|uniref:DUF4352 domain-containing protein n=1 Tax=Dysgonomonas sp. 511 TaxID=2302930 RepID=UPI0013D4DCA7|nr:DUF4352 domain-containing protein [Dysgonomonas sp. 511]NDV79804.1 DUF4352 domain-containing protein [Dysgonomonas sp. 511]
MKYFTALLFLSSFIVFIAGMIKPNVVLRFMKSPNRVHVFLFSSAIGIVSIILMLIIAPTDLINSNTATNNNTNAVQTQVESDKQNQESDNNNNKEEETSIGKEVSVGHFSYTVNSINFRKSVGDEFIGETADGIYLLVNLSIKNISDETRTLDNSCFYLTDANNVKFEFAVDASTALELSGHKTLFLKDCQPRIKTNGVLIFEVPEKDVYYLHLAGNFWGTKSARIILK